MPLIRDIWASYRRLPLWVQIWVGFILIPVNLLPVFWWNASFGFWVFLLSAGGMAPNLVVMAVERGFSRTMAWPHVILWPPLIVLIIYLLSANVALPASYVLVLKLVLVVDIISLVFDIPDVRKWWTGERSIA